jgi:hypothetical protein
MSHFLPHRRVRPKFIAEHLQEAGLSVKASEEIAAHLIPDVLVFDAVFVSSKNCYFEMIDNGLVFLNLDDQVYFCGRYHQEGFSVRSVQEWNEIQYLCLDNEERLKLPVNGLLATYDSNKWLCEHKSYNQCKFKLSVDITPTLKQFVEVSNEAIH